MRSVRNTHSWNANKCIHCGCIRIEVENPNAKWNYKQYVDPKTGEITRKMTCETKQYKLEL